MKLLVALLAWILAAFGAIEVSSVVADSIHSQTASAGGTAGSDPSALSSTASGSMFIKSNLAEALKIAHTHLGADVKIETAAIYPGYLNLTAVVNGSEVDWTLYSDGTVDQTSLNSSPSGRTFPLSHIPAGGPAELAKRIARAGHVPLSKLSYMVADLSPVSNQFEWLVYPQKGTPAEYFFSSSATGPLYEYLTRDKSGPKRIAR